MKRFLKFTLVCALAGLFAASCSKKEDEEYLLNPNQVNAPMEGMSKKVAVISNVSWKLSTPDSWIKVSPTSGTGSAEVILEIAENTTKSKRNGQVNLLSANGSLVGSIKVSQDEADPKPDNIIIAHRGAYKEYGLPDNSMAALKKAIEIGTYGSECDINITTDGQVIVLHGESFGGAPVLNNNYASLKSKAKLSNGEELPLLKDFLTAVMAGNGTKLVIDVKSLSDAGGGNAQSIKAGVAAAKLIKEMGAENRVMFIIGRLDVVKGVVGEVGGKWPVAYMNSGITPEKFLTNVGYCTKWGNFDISGFGKNPSTNKFDASYAESQYKKWTDAGVELSFYNIDTEDQIQWYLPHKDNVKACTNYPMQLLKRVGLR